MVAGDFKPILLRGRWYYQYPPNLDMRQHLLNEFRAGNITIEKMRKEAAKYPVAYTESKYLKLINNAK